METKDNALVWNWSNRKKGDQNLDLAYDYAKWGKTQNEANEKLFEAKNETNWIYFENGGLYEGANLLVTSKGVPPRW